jgi:tetratricopeptide (TPR) repeat protein
MLLMDYWPLGRRVGWRLVWEKLPLFVMAVVVGLMAQADQQRTDMLIQNRETVTMSLRIAVVCVLYAGYVLKMLWPVNLSVFYVYPSVPPAWEVVGAGLLVLVVSVLAVWWWRERGYVSVGWFWYVVTLAPYVALAQTGGQFMCDRTSYVPLAGLFIVAAWGVPDLLGRWSWGRNVAAAAAVAALAACGLAARKQAQTWRNSVTLYKHTLAAGWQSSVAHNNLAAAFTEMGNTNAALMHFQEAVRLKPDYAAAYYNLGVLLTRTGKTGEAIEAYREAVRLRPGYQQAHLRLADALVQSGNPSEAVVHYLEAVRLGPNDHVARHNLGIMLATAGKVAEAEAHYREAIRLKPDFAEAHNSLGSLLVHQGKPAEAIAHYREAVRLRPDYTAARQNLDAVLRMMPETNGAAARSDREPEPPGEKR